MNSVREYRTPLLITLGALVVALIIWVGLVSPQNSKLSSLRSRQSQLTSQQSQLQAKLADLKTEKQTLTSSCADLQKIATQIPTVQSPTDVDAEESSFESQFNGLAASTGVSLNQFSGFAPASADSGVAPTTTTPTPTTGSRTTPADVTAVPTTLAVTGNFGQMTAFINGLDNFPRLFVIQNFTLAYGTSTSGATSGSTGASSAGGPVSASGAPLWTGGSPNSSSAGPYTLSITGSIYYTSSSNALDACTKATASLK